MTSLGFLFQLDGMDSTLGNQKFCQLVHRFSVSPFCTAGCAALKHNCQFFKGGAVLPRADSPTGHTDCKTLFKQGLLSVIQFLKCPLHLLSLYAVPENVGIVPSIINGNILARFLAILVCYIERLLIADATDYFQVFFRKGKITVVLLGKLIDCILGVMVQPSH